MSLKSCCTHVERCTLAFRLEGKPAVDCYHATPHMRQIQCENSGCPTFLDWEVACIEVSDDKNL